MVEIVKDILAAPLATIFVVAGIVFLFVAAVGSISGKIDPGVKGRVISGMLGVAFIVVGLLTGDRGTQIPEEKTFSTPKWGDYRLDYCSTWAADCGLAPATAWCKAQGFAEAVRFEGPERIGVQGTSTTRLIGTNQLCAESFCDAFHSITCR